MHGFFTIKNDSKKICRKSFFKIGLFFCLFLTLSVNAYSQKYQVAQQGLVPENLDQMNKPQKTESVVSTLFKSIEGTYQIQSTNSNYRVLLSESLYQKIVSSRKENQDVYLQLDEHARLYLPSKAVINGQGFKKLENISYTSK